MAVASGRIDDVNPVDQLMYGSDIKVSGRGLGDEEALSLLRDIGAIRNTDREITIAEILDGQIVIDTTSFFAEDFRKILSAMKLENPFVVNEIIPS